MIQKRHFQKPHWYRPGVRDRNDYPVVFLGHNLSNKASMACGRIDRGEFNERDEEQWKAWLMATFMATGEREILDFGVEWLEARRKERNGIQCAS
jgi:hypothetical protein